MVTTSLRERERVRVAENRMATGDRGDKFGQGILAGWVSATVEATGAESSGCGRGWRLEPRLQSPKILLYMSRLSYID